MDPWTIGLIAVVVVGLAVIVVGALADRVKNKRLAAEMMAPPQRVIPQFKPNSPAPKYLSELQARRVPDASPVSALTAAEREQIAQELKDPTTTRIDAGYLSRDFVTDSTNGWAVLDAPRVLICSEPVESTRELLTILERLSMSKTGLVIVAPSMAKEVRGTLEVNQIRRTMRLLAVTTPADADLRTVAETTQARILSRSDLQAGYVRLEDLGTCARWVSTAKRSFVIGVPDSPGARA